MREAASAEKHFMRAIAAAERLLPADSLIRSALYVKLSMAEIARLHQSDESFAGSTSIVPRIRCALELIDAAASC